jgi:hypothetical protein
MTGFGTLSNSMMLCCRKAAESPESPMLRRAPMSEKYQLPSFFGLTAWPFPEPDPIAVVE